MAAIIMDFGRNEEGLNLYRINGSKDEIYKAIKDMKEIGCEFWGEPIVLEKTHKSFSLLIRIKIPESVRKGTIEERKIN